MNDSQKYKLILWHSFLEDMAKAKDKMKICFPGYEIQYGEIAKEFNWSVKNRKKHEILYPWLIQAKNKREGTLLVSFVYLRDFEPEEKEEVEEPTNLPNRWYCHDCQKFVMKGSRLAHIKSKKHNVINELQRK